MKNLSIRLLCAAVELEEAARQAKQLERWAAIRSEEEEVGFWRDDSDRVLSFSVDLDRVKTVEDQFWTAILLSVYEKTEANLNETTRQLKINYPRALRKIRKLGIASRMQTIAARHGKEVDFSHG